MSRYCGDPRCTYLDIVRKCSFRTGCYDVPSFPKRRFVNVFETDMRQDGISHLLNPASASASRASIQAPQHHQCERKAHIFSEPCIIGACALPSVAYLDCACLQDAAMTMVVLQSGLLGPRRRQYLKLADAPGYVPWTFRLSRIKHHRRRRRDTM